MPSTQSNPKALLLRLGPELPVFTKSKDSGLRRGRPTLFCGGPGCGTGPSSHTHGFNKATTDRSE